MLNYSVAELRIKKLNEKGANIRVIEEKEMVEIVEKYGI